jgi:hypothetical protein
MHFWLVVKQQDVSVINEHKWKSEPITDARLQSLRLKCACTPYQRILFFYWLLCLCSIILCMLMNNELGMIEEDVLSGPLWCDSIIQCKHLIERMRNLSGERLQELDLDTFWMRVAGFTYGDDDVGLIINGWDQEGCEGTILLFGQGVWENCKIYQVRIPQFLLAILLKMTYNMRLIYVSEFFSFPPHPGWLWGPPSLLFNGYQGLFLWG